jgi:hypothetical protein
MRSPDQLIPTPKTPSIPATTILPNAADKKILQHFNVVETKTNEVIPGTTHTNLVLEHKEYPGSRVEISATEAEVQEYLRSIAE